MSKHEYTYSLELNGKIIDKRSNKYKNLESSSIKLARMTLKTWFPHCNITKLETTTSKRFDTSNSQFGSAIFL